MLPWSEAIGLVADQHGFAGVVSVDRGGERVFAKAYGFADRAHQLRNTVATRFAIASGTKGLTALTVVSLIDDRALDMSTRTRACGRCRRRRTSGPPGWREWRRSGRPLLDLVVPDRRLLGRREIRHDRVVTVLELLIRHRLERAGHFPFRSPDLAKHTSRGTPPPADARHERVRGTADGAFPASRERSGPGRTPRRCPRCRRWRSPSAQRGLPPDRHARAGCRSSWYARRSLGQTIALPAPRP
jgi:hypothetical protein